jgi:hypothetical protein
MRLIHPRWYRLRATLLKIFGCALRRQGLIAGKNETLILMSQIGLFYWRARLIFWQTPASVWHFKNYSWETKF